MRDKKRIEPFLKKLQLFWEKNPDLRFGQIVYILAEKLNVWDIFFPEDDKWSEAIDKLETPYTKPKE